MVIIHPQANLANLSLLTKYNFFFKNPDIFVSTYLNHYRNVAIFLRAFEFIVEF
jgi:hypothetical protein